MVREKKPIDATPRLPSSADLSGCADLRMAYFSRSEKATLRHMECAYYFECENR
jgi:hypothetical protein